MKKVLPANLFSLFILPSALWAQNLEKAGTPDAVTVGGGLHFSQVFYASSGMPARRDPYSWFLNGNVSISLLDYSLPFSFSFSNQGRQFSQPIQLVNLNPVYKKVRLYLGNNAFAWSPYTLNGHNMLGIGMEYEPVKGLKITGAGGRLRKAVEYQPTEANEFSYRRVGFGAAAGYERDRGQFKATWFSAADAPASVSYIPLNPTVMPQKNTSLSLGGSYRFSPKWQFTADQGFSYLTVQNEKNSSGWNGISFNGKSAYGAGKAGLTWQEKIFALNATYERIAPGYRTLGTYFFTSDLETWSLNPSCKLFKGTITMNASAGYQRNNLHDDRLQQNKRMAAAFGVQGRAGNNVSGGINYSNFSTVSRFRKINDNPYLINTDTLDYVQVCGAWSGNVSVKLGGGNTAPVWMSFVNHQKTGETRGKVEENLPYGSLLGGSGAPAKLMNATSTVSKSWSGTGWQAAAGGQWAENIFSSGKQTQAGPLAQVSKGWKKNRYKVSAGGCYQWTKDLSGKSGQVLSLRLGGNAQPSIRRADGVKPGFQLSTVYCLRNGREGEVTLQAGTVIGF